MITCGRCGEPAGVGGYGNNFHIFEKFRKDGQKYGIKTELCDKCQRDLVDWLNSGGYRDHKGPALPVRSTVAEIVELRNKLNALINKLDTKVTILPYEPSSIDEKMFVQAVSDPIEIRSVPQYEGYLVRITLPGGDSVVVKAEQIITAVKKCVL